MSVGAIFKLTANDGKADRMIMATKLLNQRIKDVMCARARDRKADVTPTLVDLERTHILYVNAHFKPYAAIAFEYSKVRPQSGTSALGSGVTFSIPQFGDFFHDMVCRSRLSQCMGNSGFTPLQSQATTAVFPSNTTTGDIPETPNAGPQTNVFYSLVDPFGKVVVNGVNVAQVTPSPQVAYRNFVRYCEYPGNRLFTSVKFDVNGNPLDNYDETIPMMLEKFCTLPHKRTGHDRLVGQEVPLTGYGPLLQNKVSDADVSNTPNGVINRSGALQSNQTVGLFKGATLGAASGTVTGQTSTINLNSEPANQFDVSRRLLQYVNGPQTPKPIQPPLEIWNKLKFWFNDDVRLSIASVCIPFGQRFIAIDYAKTSDLVYEFPSLYLRKDVHVLSSGFGADSITTTFSPVFQSFGVTDITVDKMELYINNIFVNPEIHDIYIRRIGFSLIRVYRQHRQTCNAESSEDKQLTQLKWPIEYLFVGLRPSWNTRSVTVGSGGLVSGGNQNQWRDWHRLTRMVDVTDSSETLSFTVLAPAIDYTAPVAPATNFTGTIIGTGKRTGVSNDQVVPNQYWLPVPTVDSLTLTAHGVVVFESFNDTFFNQYMPFHFGGTNLVTPDDPGALFVNMALFPRSYQPSGHLNISRARETFLKWTTSYISPNTSSELICVAVAINFLLITDGSAVLRYST